MKARKYVGVKVIAFLLFTIFLSGCLNQSSSPRSIEGPSPELSSASDLISQESLFSYLDDLTSIQAHSGWRNSASTGEYEALDYVSRTLDDFSFLEGLGMELERQEFHVYLSTELWETLLYLTLDGKEIEVPADGMRGSRDTIRLALNFDSDGTLNDSRRDPITAQGNVAVVTSEEEWKLLDPAKMKDTIVFLNYDLVSPFAVGTTQASAHAQEVLSANPSGIVLITEFSNERKKSHGAFAGEGGVFMRIYSEKKIPILYSRLEDMASSGIHQMSDLKKIEKARLVWDADVFSPGRSQNLIARIPGKDTLKAVILGAHIDSPASPGAMDDGSGSVALMEVARVLDESRIQPPVDLYLVWFGSEELNIYGSPYFASTHSELLDRTLAMVEVDCLAHPLAGLEADITLEFRASDWAGDVKTPLSDFLAQRVAALGIETKPISSSYPTEAFVFSGFDVPNINLIYSGKDFEATGSWHYAAHVHDPYDTAKLAREVGEVLVEMTRVALAAALEIGAQRPDLRLTPPKERRVLFVASHMESAHMTPSQFTDLGITLAREGFDMDMIPYGQKITSEDLDGVDAIIVPPVLDYPSPEGDVSLYDEEWSEEEIEILVDYVSKGGTLILANSAFRLQQNLTPRDTNEDWQDINALAKHFGVVFIEPINSPEAQVSDNELMKGLSSLRLVEGNGITFTLERGQILASSNGRPVLAVVDFGSRGQVIVLSDFGILGSPYYESFNIGFLQNLALYLKKRAQPGG